MRKAEITRHDIFNELAALKRSFEQHVKDDDMRFTKIEQSLVTMNTNLEELLEIVRAFSRGKSLIAGLSIFIGSMVGIVMGLRQIVAWLK